MSEPPAGKPEPSLAVNFLKLSKLPPENEKDDLSVNFLKR
jgi:hypothetical protein